MKINIAEIAEKLKKFRFNKKTIIAVIAMLAIGAAGVTAYKIKSGKNSRIENTGVQYTMLSKTSVLNTVSSSGAIKSGSSTNVYSNFSDSYTLQEVNVEVGDQVKKGDILAVIDTSDFEDEISQLESQVEASKKKAKLTLDQKQKAYEDAVYLYENGSDTGIVNAQASLDSAKLSLDNKQKIYEYYKMLNENGEASAQELREKEIDYENAKTDYNKAQVSLEASKVSAEQSVRNAKSDYESALANYNDDSSEKQLEAKKAKLADREVVAPCDGTITSVNVAVGDKCGSGAFFVIQDLQDLIVNVDVDETEIADVKTGQKVQITTDASGSDVLEGEVISVDPISSSVASDSSSSSSGSGGSSASNSSNSTSSDVTFTVKVQIKGQNELVKVGMNAVVNIITDEADDVYAVPYEAVKRLQGKSIIYEAEKQSDNKYVVKSVSVETGLESDVYMEISGAGLKDGMFVLNDASKYNEGDIVDIQTPRQMHADFNKMNQSGQDSKEGNAENNKKKDNTVSVNTKKE